MTHPADITTCSSILKAQCMCNYIMMPSSQVIVCGNDVLGVLGDGTKCNAYFLPACTGVGMEGRGRVWEQPWHSV